MQLPPAAVPVVLQPTVWSVAVICAAYQSWLWLNRLLQQQLEQQRLADKQRALRRQQQQAQQQYGDIAPASQHTALQQLPCSVAPNPRGTAVVTGEFFELA